MAGSDFIPFLGREIFFHVSPGPTFHSRGLFSGKDGYFQAINCIDDFS
jgi:hypothetical protein